MTQQHLFIDGEFTAGHGTPMDAVNPYTESAWAQIDTATPDDVSDAVAAAERAFESWRRVSGLRRAELLNALADELNRGADGLAEIESTDNGKIIRETRSQMRFAARNYRFVAGAADKLDGCTKMLDSRDTVDLTTLEPLGPVALITPWNSPIGILANKLGPALAAGNTVVIKPSEHTTASTLAFAEMIRRAGFPPGVVNIISGSAVVGEALATDPRIRRISFTGSPSVGRRMAEYAARNLIPTTLELGGKGANVVCSDADLSRAIPGVLAGIFAASGQTCVAGSRLLIHRSLHDEVVEVLAGRAETVRCGDPLQMETEMGPVAHRGQRESILGFIDRARDDGAELVAGGRDATERIGGLFIAPTIFTGVRPDAELAREEVFGPVLAVIAFDDDDEAVAIANSTDYGLASGVWTESLRRGHRIARELRSGTVWVNTYRSSAAQAPFGGMKRSGYGRERGLEAISEYVQVKNTMIELSDEVRDPFAIKV
jgi:aldehyde dehydrogenase (NAD+)